MWSAGTLSSAPPAGKRGCVRSSSGCGLRPNPILFSPDLLHRLLVGLGGRVEPLGPFHIEERLVVVPPAAVEQAAVEIDQRLLLVPLGKGYCTGKALQRLLLPSEQGKQRAAFVMESCAEGIEQDRLVKPGERLTVALLVRQSPGEERQPGCPGLCIGGGQGRYPAQQGPTAATAKS